MDVAEGGNQTMVAVGVAVPVGTGVAVGSSGPMGRQAVARSVMASRIEQTTLPARADSVRLGFLACRHDIKRESLIVYL